MAKLTKAQKASLQVALRHLTRAHAFIMQNDVAVGRLGTLATTTLHYVRPSDGHTFYAIDKNIGSDLTGVAWCMDILKAMIDERNSTS